MAERLARRRSSIHLWLTKEVEHIDVFSSIFVDQIPIGENVNDLGVVAKFLAIGQHSFIVDQPADGQGHEVFRVVGDMEGRLPCVSLSEAQHGDLTHIHLIGSILMIFVSETEELGLPVNSGSPGRNDQSDAKAGNVVPL